MLFQSRSPRFWGVLIIRWRTLGDDCVLGEFLGRSFSRSHHVVERAGVKSTWGREIFLSGGCRLGEGESVQAGFVSYRPGGRNPGPGSGLVRVL
jgi:hypothetical protein